MQYSHSGFAPPSSDEQELWEVVIAPDDIKLLTLEQLDDAFRLDVIGVSTLVRQQGTANWQRLGVVAGIESDSESGAASDWNDEAESLPLPSFPAGARAAPSRAPSYAAAAHPFWNAAAAPRALPLLEAPILAAPAAPVLEPPSFDSLVGAQAEPVFSTPQSALRNVGRPRRSRTSFWLLMLAASAGALWAVHRNDLLRAGARRLGMEAKYLSFEKSTLRTPGFGTPRSLEAFLAEQGVTAAAAPIESESSATADRAAAQPPAPSNTSKRSAPAEQAPADKTKAVSLDALPLLPASEPAERAVSAPAPKPAPPAARAQVQSSQKAAPAAKARPEKISLDEAPARPRKPEDPLKAAIRTAIEKQNKKK